jgi:hypothetical protein
MSRSCIFNPVAWIKALFGRGSKVTHEPKQFAPFVVDASRLVYRHGGPGKVRRSSRWTLEIGRRISSFGEDDWTFSFQGDRVLGVVVPGDPLKVFIGSPDGERFNRHTALHEAGHVVLMPNGDYGHDPRYRPAFQGWSDTGRRLPSPDMLVVHVDYPDGWSDTRFATAADIRDLETRGGMLA